MKPNYYLIVCICLVTIISGAYAEVLRVNNQLPASQSQKIFASIGEAHDFAQAGDTLMIEGSPLDYSGAVFTKKLVVFGTGYFLTENSGVHASMLSGRIRGDIKLSMGSEGTFLIGLSFSASATARPVVSVSDITIMRSYLPTGIAFDNCNCRNIIIIQNYFDHSGGTALSTISARETFTDVVFNNNIVHKSMYFNVSLENQLFSQVSHNIFRGSVEIRAELFRNNIITSDASVNIQSPDIQNNLTLGSQLTGASNQKYIASELFVAAEENSPDGQFRLKQDSPYLSSGFDKKEPGVFGGDTPYVLSGIPPIPTIYEFSASSFANQQNGLTIQLRAKTNN